MTDRARLAQRLAIELGDEVLARAVGASIDDEVVAGLVRLAEGDIEGSAALAYRPPTVPAAEVDSLWVLAYGYRFAAGVDATGVRIGERVPTMAELVPGPTNEHLARVVADLVAQHPVPVIAQWEVARVLADLGVAGVISVEPDVADDGSVVYLSTLGVVEKGLALAGAAGIVVGRAGVLGHADHVVRCVMTARHVGLHADAPDGAALPSAYDRESGQVWTRARDTWIPVDLFARTFLVPSRR